MDTTTDDYVDARLGTTYRLRLRTFYYYYATRDFTTSNTLATHVLLWTGTLLFPGRTLLWPVDDRVTPGGGYLLPWLGTALNLEPALPRTVLKTLKFLWKNS